MSDSVYLYIHGTEKVALRGQEPILVRSVTHFVNIAGAPTRYSIKEARFYAPRMAEHYRGRCDILAGPLSDPKLVARYVWCEGTRSVLSVEEEPCQSGLPT